MAFTIESAAKLQEAAKLFEELRTKDIFSTVGDTFAAVGDVLGGRATASSLIQKHGGRMSAAERERARNELLKTLANYQKGRREDLRVRDQNRLNFLKEQYGNVTGERRWAMEQLVDLEKKRMGGQDQITSARLNQLAAEMRDSDRKLERGGFRAAENDNQRRAMIDAGTLVRVDRLIGELQNMRTEDESMDPGTIAAQFESTVGSVPAGQAEHVMNLLTSVVPGDFENAMIATGQDPSIRNQFSAFKNTVDRALSEEERHKQQREEWQENRDRVWSSFERQGAAGASRDLVAQLKSIYNESPEDTTRRVDEMIESLPDDIKEPAEERDLAPDAFTRQIQEQLDRLDDPRFMFSGSRHEQLKMEIMRSPEFQQYMAEKADGGMMDPNEAFRMMIKETKSGLLVGNQNARTVAAANARALGGPMAAEMQAQGGSLGRFPEFTNRTRRVNTVPLDPSRPMYETAPEVASQALGRFTERRQALSDRLSGTTKKRDRLRSMAEETMTNAAGFRESTMRASKSAEDVGRLVRKISAQQQDE